MAATLTPIETIYKKYRFRSRLEARWAVFFDHCGIKYEYEPEGFVLSDGEKYLPDFYLPEQDAYVEVKSIGAINIRFEDDEVWFEDGREKASKYGCFIHDAVYAGHTAIIVQGDPTDCLTGKDHGGNGCGNIFTLTKCVGCGKDHMTAFPFMGFADNKIILTCTQESVKSGHFYPSNNMDYFCLLIYVQGDDGKLISVEHINIEEESVHAGFINAMGGMIAARQARFEHGEDGTGR